MNEKPAFDQKPMTSEEDKQYRELLNQKGVLFRKVSLENGEKILTTDICFGLPDWVLRPIFPRTEAFIKWCLEYLKANPNLYSVEICGNGFSVRRFNNLTGIRGGTRSEFWLANEALERHEK